MYIVTQSGEQLHEGYVRTGRETPVRLLIDTARAEPMVIEKHGRPVVVVMAVEEFERLKALDDTSSGEPRKY